MDWHSLSREKHMKTHPPQSGGWGTGRARKSVKSKRAGPQNPQTEEAEALSAVEGQVGGNKTAGAYVFSQHPETRRYTVWRG